jgi:uncharacterized protein (DUF1697 family)
MTTRRYAALLRGVSPVNAKMPELKAAFEAAGFEDVRTVLSSGNVLFGARPAAEAALQRAAEAAMEARLGKAFPAIVREVAALEALLASEPWEAFTLPPGAKRVVTFLRERPAVRLSLPIEQDGAFILGVLGREVFTAYLPSPKGPVFMTLLERTFGQEITTRTWDTIGKIAREGRGRPGP